MHLKQVILFAQLLMILLCQAYGRYIQGERLLRLKRDHGVTGPVHTYVKTDKHANFKWGVRHHVGHHYSG
ncbi:hypothetical protein RN001_013079 [Aquatica leii]|uniref:Secreted protein n=1 Tax=Aquatica leii TaxID=1421715 RepID=A0AAN7SDM2_9COLE|nr:hypothetical protein RN001_013079 [Aquatica leii]